MVGSTFTRNSADGFGGGILNDGTANLSGNVFTSNTAGTGGGLCNGDGLASGTANVSGNTFTSNLAANGGGIYNASGTLNPSDRAMTTPSQTTSQTMWARESQGKRSTCNG